MKGLILLFLLFLQTIISFDSNEMAMFDLVEELDMTFYEFLGVQQDASSAEIKRAYRKLTLQYHPDKNPGNDEVSAKFRQLSGIYSVLKEEESRQQYDDVLEYGLPDWRQPAFYYRQLRKMTNVELIVGMCLIFICIHYAAIWGIAYEKRWTFEEQLNTAYKKHKLSGKKLESVNIQIKDDLQQVPLPGFFDILPFALLRGVVSLLKSIPSSFNFILSLISKNSNDCKTLKKDKLPPKKSKELKERKIVSSPKNEPLKKVMLNPRACKNLEEVEISSKVNTDHWTLDDEQQLIILINKLPNNSSKWTSIANTMQKPFDEVIYFARNLLKERMSSFGLNNNKESASGSNFEVNENAACFDSENEQDADSGNKEVDIIINGDQIDENVDYNDTHVSHRHAKLMEEEQADEMKENDKLWTKIEHQKLEAALKIYTKDNSDNRWQSIADHVGTKSKDEVIKRCKLISAHCKRKNAKMFV